MPKDALPRVSLEGSEVVRRKFMSHIKEIILTVRPDGIQFNNSCVQRMEECDYINILINRKKRGSSCALAIRTIGTRSAGVITKTASGAAGSSQGGISAPVCIG